MIHTIRHIRKTSNFRLLSSDRSCFIFVQWITFLGVESSNKRLKGETRKTIRIFIVGGRRCGNGCKPGKFARLSRFTGDDGSRNLFVGTYTGGFGRWNYSGSCDLGSHSIILPGVGYYLAGPA
jgi:hypothetical protein